MQRYGMVVGLRPEHREEYLALHAAVWAEVEAMIRKCNIRNYTIFIHGEQLFGYFEYVGDDFEADQALMAADPVTRQWWALTGPCQQRLPDAPPGEQWSTAQEIWHLD